jgi:la-related protein 1
MPLAPMVGPPAYPYFQALHEPQPDAQPDAEADAEDNHAKLIKQIEFYFRWLLLESIAICRKNRLPLHFYWPMIRSLLHSKDNLCTDVFLRRQMDDQGWVDISLIAGFKKVTLTAFAFILLFAMLSNIQLLGFWFVVHIY